MILAIGFLRSHRISLWIARDEGRNLDPYWEMIGLLPYFALFLDKKMIPMRQSSVSHESGNRMSLR